MADTPESGQKQPLFCNRCRNVTHHHSIAEHTKHEQIETDYGQISNTWKYSLWACDGCESAQLMVAYQSLEMSLEDRWEVILYPKPSFYDVRAKHFRQLPERLFNIYLESLNAFNSGLYILCSVGLRALLEGICDTKGINGKNLEAKIEGLKTILPVNIVANLHMFRFIGNTAVHELTPPDSDVLRLAIEIVEDLLNFLYELDYKTNELNLWMPGMPKSIGKYLVKKGGK